MELGLFGKVALTVISTLLTFIVLLMMRSINRSDKKRDKESDSLESLSREVAESNFHLKSISDTVRDQSVITAKNADKINDMGKQLAVVITKQDGLEKTVEGIQKKLNT